MHLDIRNQIPYNLVIKIIIINRNCSWIIFLYHNFALQRQTKLNSKWLQNQHKQNAPHSWPYKSWHEKPKNYNYHTFSHLSELANTTNLGKQFMCHDNFCTAEVLLRDTLRLYSNIINRLNCQTYMENMNNRTRCSQWTAKHYSYMDGPQSALKYKLQSALKSCLKWIVHPRKILTKSYDDTGRKKWRTFCIWLSYPF